MSRTGATPSGVGTGTDADRQVEADHPGNGMNSVRRTDRRRPPGLATTELITEMTTSYE